MSQTAILKETSKRLLSVDAFRALNMLCMIFINDLSGVRGMPLWMDHAKMPEDRMGFADTIFPAFLFIVGLSIPLAIGRKIQKGDPFKSIAFAILSRSFALLVMGFLHVNMENYNSHDAVLPEAVWEICITLGFFLIWLDYSDALAKWKKYSLVGLGWLLLLLMAFLFVGGEPGKPEGLDPSWWGILGIIGWSYLVCGFVFLLGRGKFSVMVVAMIVLALINIVAHETLLHLYWSVIHYTPSAIPPVHKRLPHFSVWVIGDASSAFLVMAGTVVSLWTAKLTAKGYQQSMWIALLIAGIGVIALGLLVRPYTEGISKIRSTPSWIFICSGISILVFELMIYLVDYKGKKNWFKFIWPAGTATLTCYLLPYFQVAIMRLVHFHYPKFMDEGIGGFFRSWLVAFVIVWIGGILERNRLKLKI